LAFVFPVHPNPNVKNVVFSKLSRCPRVHLVEPMDYTELVYILKRCKIVLTDSGGLQEEAPAFGKPVLVMRSETERPEGILAGVARLIGTETKDIVNNVVELLTKPNVYASMNKAVNPYGDGLAAQRIVRILRKTIKL